MGPTGSKALLLLFVRIGQVLINIAYVVTIGLTSADSGRWTYKSIELAAALGGEPMIPILRGPDDGLSDNVSLQRLLQR